MNSEISGEASVVLKGNCDLAAGERWYAVQSLARREVRAHRELAQQGFRPFLPVMIRTVRHARKARDVKAAAFPGYLFVPLDLERDRWRSINGTIGVSRIIAGDKGPIPVPRGVVETLLDYCDANGVCRFDRDLIEGQSVRIVNGPLAEMVGKLVRLDANGRVRVLLEILGGQVLATLDRAGLQAA
ncbi:transcriptional antiterminator RfaH [Rhodoblastus acidophilus]|uniref:transcription termination/antitermination protein NusG n=1 Tax=Rhodoblastus acidophilus TaxID=1074 RepID=UPI0022245C9B|nr:transcription termination/antitermination NusG family protein [Rhodoblastus acidophilus]MCW2284307.1 transcriptional antiterminator RfaH [Rhodoblastus acidophilus]MCW2333215.1 transcriptional antiterminator RfaH [Rhodoblastus acidophilus]